MELRDALILKLKFIQDHLDPESEEYKKIEQDINAFCDDEINVKVLLNSQT